MRFLESFLHPDNHVQRSQQLEFSQSCINEIYGPHTLYCTRKITNGRVIQTLQCHQRTPGNCQLATFPSWVGSFIVLANERQKYNCITSLADSNLKQPKGFTSNPRSELQKATSRLKANRTGEVAIGSQLKEQSSLLNQASGFLQYSVDDICQ